MIYLWQGLGGNPILGKVLIGTMQVRLLFEAGLRADEPFTWPVLAIPLSWLYLDPTGRKRYFEILSRDDCPQCKVKAEVQLKLSL